MGFNFPPYAQQQDSPNVHIRLPELRSLLAVRRREVIRARHCASSHMNTSYNVPVSSIKCANLRSIRPVKLYTNY